MVSCFIRIPKSSVKTSVYNSLTAITECTLKADCFLPSWNNWKQAILTNGPHCKPCSILAKFIHYK